MHHFFKGRFFDFETVRILGTAVYGGSDVAEVLEAVGEIRDGDPDSWCRAWATQAERALQLAEAAHSSGDRAAARNAYLRGANYTRASGYMLLAGDARKGAVTEEVNSIFRKAAALFSHPVHFLDIPYTPGGGSTETLPAHLYLPSPEHRLPGKTPILISNGGADAIQEELYFMHPAAGPELGYAVLTFEGPGQGVKLWRDCTTLRPDWEVVIGRVLDFLEGLASTHPELDLDTSRIVIAGASLGGYFALRAAADPRIKACVSLDPLYSFWDFAQEHASPMVLGAWDRGWIGDGLINAAVGAMMRLSFQMRWELKTAAVFFGMDPSSFSPASVMRAMKGFTLGGGYLQRVRCPVLVSGASESLYLEGVHHTMRVFNDLVSLSEGDKELWMTTTPGQGSLQAKMGALRLANQRTFRFLDQKLDIKRSRLP